MQIPVTIELEQSIFTEPNGPFVDLEVADQTGSIVYYAKLTPKQAKKVGRRLIKSARKAAA